MTEFSQRHRDILADRLSTTVAPGRRGGEPFAKMVREGDETVVLRAALLAMVDAEAAARRQVITELATAAHAAFQGEAWRLITAAWECPVSASPPAPKELAPNVWHETKPVTKEGALPPGLRPNDRVGVIFRDGVQPPVAYLAKNMSWAEDGDGTIVKFKIIADPRPAPSADAWRKIPIDAGMLFDLWTMPPEFDKPTSLKLLAEARAR